MGGNSRGKFILVILALQLLSILILVGFAHSQGIQTSPYSASSMVRGLSGQGLDLAPSNPLGLPGSSLPQTMDSDTVSLSSGMFPSILPPIPNLQFGYLYHFGNNVRSGRFTADYLLPVRLSADSRLFGEAHTEFQSFWKKPGGFSNRADVSLGGGYRTILRNSTLVGVNGFYDTSRLGEEWYSSGSFGFEMAALVSGNDALDLHFNWYGKLFNSNVIRNAFRFGPSNYDFQAGYSHELWNGGPDLRLSATGYKFEVENSVYGWNAGAELKSRDGMFVLKYDVGNDRINQTYQTVGAFVNVGCQLENVLKGESPFTMPEPIFKSPRNLKYMLTQQVKRDWHQPSTVVLARTLAAEGQGLIRTASIPLLSLDGSGVYVTSAPGAFQFEPVPYQQLDPTKHVRVDFHYCLSGPPPRPFYTDLGVAAADGNTSLVSHRDFHVPGNPQCADVSFILITGTQSRFTTPHIDPASMRLVFNGGPPYGTVTVTDVVIMFNQ